MSGLAGSVPSAREVSASVSRLSGPWRRAVVYVVIATIVAASVLAIVRDPPLANEPWPFSAYRLYAQANTGRYVSRHRLFGVTREDPPGEIPLVDEYLQPFEHLRFTYALLRLRREKRRAGALEEGLRDVLSRYEARRRAGKHDGPALRGVRLYHLRWRLVERVPQNRDVPDERRLLFEISE